ncbi:MAG TPA: hypothetical protein DCW97_07015 [Acidobacteria bacterium]|nr:hypothetical protein [Acidobacteriota bacterium]
MASLVINLIKIVWMNSRLRASGAKINPATISRELSAESFHLKRNFFHRLMSPQQPIEPGLKIYMIRVSGWPTGLLLTIPRRLNYNLLSDV